MSASTDRRRWLTTDAYIVSTYLNEDGALQRQPLDIDNIASAMEVDDPVAQEDLLRAIFQANVVPEADTQRGLCIARDKCVSSSSGEGRCKV